MLSHKVNSVDAKYRNCGQELHEAGKPFAKILSMPTKLLALPLAENLLKGLATQANPKWVKGIETQFCDQNQRIGTKQPESGTKQPKC